MREVYIREYTLSQQLNLGELPETRCADCFYLGLNHDPDKHCLRAVMRPPGICGDFDQIEELPIYTLAELGFVPETYINGILEGQRK